MPQKAQGVLKSEQVAANQAKTPRQFNPTITAFFDAPKFGIKDETGNGIEGTAFLSANIDTEAFETLQKHVSIGSKLLLRQSVRLNKNGGRTFYLEALPPMTQDSKYSNHNQQPDSSGDEV